MQRRLWLGCVWIVVMCAWAAGCDDDGSSDPEQQDANTSDADGFTSAECPSGQASEGVCLPSPPQFTDWTCPEGWTPTPALVDASGVALAIEGVSPWTRCEPPPLLKPPETCPPGFMPLFGQAECARQGSECPADAWPSDDDLRARTPNYQGRIWFVSPSAAGSGNGSREAPFLRISEALSAAGRGDIIALGKGSFAEEVVINQSLALVGACVEETTIASTIADETLATVAIQGLGGVLVRDLSITGPRMGLAAQSTAAPSVIASVTIREAQKYGAFVDNASITWLRTLITQTQPSASDQRFGNGLVCTNQASCNVSESALTHNRNKALFVGEAALIITDSLVAHTLPEASDNQGGLGIQLNAATATLEYIMLLNNSGYGIALTEGASATILQAAIADVQKSAGVAYGVYIDNSEAELTALSAAGGEVGVRLDNAKATLRDVHVVQTEGSGLSVLGASDLTAERIAILHTGMGFGISSGEGGVPEVDLTDVLVAYTTGTTNVIGPGLLGGALRSTNTVLDASRLALIGNYGASVLITEEGTFSATDMLVANGFGGEAFASPGDVDASGVGLAAFQTPLGAPTLPIEITLQRAVFDHNQTQGLLIVGDVQLDLTDATITRTQPDPANARFGEGFFQLCQAETSACTSESANLTRVSIEHNHSAGLMARNISLTAKDLYIAHTQPEAASARFGYGLEIAYGSNANIERLAVLNNQYTGLIVEDPNTKATINHCVIRDTTANDCSDCTETLGGLGIIANLNASLNISHFEITNSAFVGFLIRAGASVSAQSGKIANNLIGISLNDVDVSLENNFQDVLLIDNDVDQDFSEINLPAVPKFDILTNP